MKQAFVRRLEAALLPLGLTHMRFMVLRVAGHLARAGRRPTQARLAGTMATGRMMVSKVLRLLEGKALVARPVHPKDARARRVVLTEAARSCPGAPFGGSVRTRAFGGAVGLSRGGGVPDNLPDRAMREGLT